MIYLQKKKIRSKGLQDHEAGKGKKTEKADQTGKKPRKSIKHQASFKNKQVTDARG